MTTDREVADILADTTKQIDGDIRWGSSRTHRDGQAFSAVVQSMAGWPLRVEARRHLGHQRLSYSLIYDDRIRIFGLDLGPGIGHHNPECRKTRSAKAACDCPRGTHIQIWDEADGGQRAEAAPQITAAWDDPVAAWRQFCAEINLAHRGILQEPEEE